MAEKRMFSMKIIDSDSFLSLPLSTQALYFHLCMRSDDDGFLNNCKRIMNTINANQNDYDLLKAKSFIIEFDDGIVVIKHWRINNYIRSDRYRPTNYTEEKNMLYVKKNGAYTLDSNSGTPCIPQNVSESKAEEVKRDSVDPRWWKQTFEIYPKKFNEATAFTCWLDKFRNLATGCEKGTANEIFKATKLFLADYVEKNPDDTDYKYLKSYDKWLKEDCDYWIQKYRDYLKEKENA